MSTYHKKEVTKILRSIASALCLFQTTTAEIFVKIGPIADPDDEEIRKLTLNFYEGEKDNYIEVFATQGSPWKKTESYAITKSGTTEPLVEIEQVTTPRGGDSPGAIHLELKKPIVAVDYDLKIKGKWTLARGSKEYVYHAPDEIHKITKDSIAQEQAYQKQIGFRNSAEIAKADEGTALDFNFFYFSSRRHMFGFDEVRHEARIKGQIGFDTDDRNVFADAWSAEYSLNARTRTGDLWDRWRMPVYYAVSSTLEADRDFENVAGLAGVWVKVETAFLGKEVLEVFDNINPFINLNDPLEPAPLAPFWELGYQFATTLEKDVGRVNYGDHRITGRLSWDFPLFRRVGPEAFLVNGDLVIAAQGVYHPDTEKFTDETKVSAIFRRDTDEENPLIFTITYQQGKASPTFENYDALLVGFRQFF